MGVMGDANGIPMVFVGFHPLQGIAMGQFLFGVQTLGQFFQPGIESLPVFQQLPVHSRHVDEFFQYLTIIAAGKALDDGAAGNIFDGQGFQGRWRHGRRAFVGMKLRALQGHVQQILVQLQIVLDVGFLLALFHLVQRRLGNIDMAPLDEFRHLPVEEGEQQGANMGAIHVRIRHDDDAVVTQLVRIEFLPADTAAQSRNQGAYLRR